MDNISINEYAVASGVLNSDVVYVLVLTNNHWIEIYPSTSLSREPIFSLNMRYPTRVHSTPKGNFYVLTCKGSVHFIKQEITSTNEIQYNQTAQTQLKIKCSMMLSSTLTLNGLECLVVFADNAQSMSIWTTDRIINVNIDVSPFVSSTLKSVTGDQADNLLLLYFNNKTLISSQVNLKISNDKASVQLTPFDEVDKFCLRKDCLAAYNNGKTHLSLHNIRSDTCYEPIQLENECIELCLNESVTYVFALVKPRVLFMYRINDRKQLAKLFVYDFVTFMVADNEFLVMALNDRRLLTLMIADPDDPTVQTRIQALPSR